MNKKEKSRIRKLKEENRKLKKKYNDLNKFDISQYSIGIDYVKEQKNQIIENVLKLFIKRHYGRIEHTHTRIDIDEREIEGMKNYSIEIEKNFIYPNTISILVK